MTLRRRVLAGGAVNLLMKGALNSMFWNRMKAGAAALVVVVSLAGTAGMLSRGSLASRLGGDKAIPPALSWPPSTRKPRTKRRPGTRKRAAEASDEVTIENAPPVVVKTVPQSGDTEVDPNLKEIQVTFSKEMMDKSWSWSTASKNTFPERKATSAILMID